MGVAPEPDRHARGSERRPRRPPRPAARFLDFSIRAWLEGHSVGIIVHASPVGGMRAPAFVRIGAFDAAAYRIPLRGSWHDAASIGRELARWVFPPPVWALVVDSLRAIAELPDTGLRLRLCLADELIDLPWEYLYRPDVTDQPAPRTGFLLMDSRLSLVREPPVLLGRDTPPTRRQRGLFVGTLWNDDTDGWSVRQEFRSLKKSLASLSDLIEVESVFAHDADGVRERLSLGCDFFHYAGHVDIEGDRGTLLSLANASVAASSDWELLSGKFEADPVAPSWNRVEVLAPLLKRAGVRCAMLNACNSGFWPVARQFVHAGIGCLVGVQGLVSNLAALHFAERLYKSLALGLSVDEAVSWARLHIMDDSRSWWPLDWGRFMVYMPAESAVLFPAGRHKALSTRREKAIQAREDTVRRTRRRASKHDAESFQRQLSDMANVCVLILGRFTEERKAVLDDIRRALTTLDREYVPILFDFEKASERDLIESVIRFAGVSRFVIADLSDPKSIPAELQAIVPLHPSVPIVPLIEDRQREYPVSDHILRRESVLQPVVRYRDRAHLRQIFVRDVIEPAERLVTRLRPPLLV